MYKMNFDRAVLALWDEKLKEDLHENFYDLIPITLQLARDPQLGIKTIEQKLTKGESSLSIMAKWILEIEDPDLHELRKFIVTYHSLLMDRILKILDKEELGVQIKRRRLLD